MEKTAQEKNPSELMSLYVVFLRALYLIHQKNHWQTPGYAEHLLFQRLYEGVAEPMDEAAEKTVGVYGELTKQEKVSVIADQFDGAKFEGKGAVPYLLSSLAAEEAFQKFAERVYNMLKESGAITLGVDDMIMSHASTSEVRIYLLKQSLKEHQD